MALQNQIVIEGKLVRYEMKVVKDFSIGTGSIARSFGKEKPMAFFDFEIWNPSNDLDEMLQNAASEEVKPFVRLTGSLRQDVWQDKEGKTNRKIKITATDIEGIQPDFSKADNGQKQEVRNVAKPGPRIPVIQTQQATKQVVKQPNKPYVRKPVVSQQEDETIPF